MPEYEYATLTYLNEVAEYPCEDDDQTRKYGRCVTYTFEHKNGPVVQFQQRRDDTPFPSVRGEDWRERCEAWEARPLVDYWFDSFGKPDFKSQQGLNPYVTLLNDLGYDGWDMIDARHDNVVTKVLDGDNGSEPYRSVYTFKRVVPEVSYVGHDSQDDTEEWDTRVESDDECDEEPVNEHDVEQARSVPPPPPRRVPRPGPPSLTRPGQEKE